MTIAIDYDQGDYTITADGAVIDHASTYHAADAIANAYLEARNSAMMGGDPLLTLAGRFAQAGRCATCGDGGDCPDCGTYTGRRCDFCYQAALYFVQYPSGVFSYCPACFEQRHFNTSIVAIANTPLLADCAQIIRRCLGQTTGAASIVEELRRVEDRLRQEGW